MSSSYVLCLGIGPCNSGVSAIGIQSFYLRMLMRTAASFFFIYFICTYLVCIVIHRPFHLAYNDNFELFNSKLTNESFISVWYWDTQSSDLFLTATPPVFFLSIVLIMFSLYITRPKLKYILPNDFFLIFSITYQCTALCVENTCFCPFTWTASDINVFKACLLFYVHLEG